MDRCIVVRSPRGRSYAEINEWLMDRCIEDAKKHPHPTIPGKTVWQVFEEERPFLVAYRGPFDGFHASEVSVSKTCLVRFDNNQYSVAASGRAGLCRSDRHPPGRRDRRRASPELRARPDRLRSVALRADPDEEARRAVQWRALQGLAVAHRARPPANPARGPRRRRPAVRQGARGGARGRAGGGRSGLCRSARVRRLQRHRAPRARPAPTWCSTSSPGSASRHRRQPSRRPRACSFATSRLPTVSATTA